MSRNEPESDYRLSRRLKLRDLAIFAAVVELGSMARAAKKLMLSQPAVSQSITELESAVGVRLVERGPRGVTATQFGIALARRGGTAFDAVRLALRDIEFLADPGSGEVWVGASESYVSGGVLSQIIDRISQRYPGIVVHAIEANTAARQYEELRAHTVDLMLGRLSGPLLDEDLTEHKLFDEHILVVAGSASPWARRRRISFSELTGEKWVLAPPHTVVNDMVAKAFRTQGATPPRISVSTYSMQLRMQLLSSGQYITVLPASAVKFNAGRWPIKVLPLNLGEALPVCVITLKHRVLSPAAELFVEQAKQLYEGSSR
jgi:DNA-binding transcriptional LysR family regulator